MRPDEPVDLGPVPPAERPRLLQHDVDVGAAGGKWTDDVQAMAGEVG
ncbi:MAG: hypothetical protein R2695_21470 [Acidimicrobiales bacterium]